MKLKSAIKPEIMEFDNSDDFIRGCHRIIVETLSSAIMSRNNSNPVATIALAGGNTPIPLYSYISQSVQRKKAVTDKFKTANFDPINFFPDNSSLWKKIHIFWSDERITDSNSNDSNSGQTLKAFSEKGPNPFALKNIHLPMNGKTDNSSHAASLYNEHIMSFFSRMNLPISSSMNLPQFDLIILGMGLDGHVASLFPGNDLRGSESVIPAIAPEGMPVRHRISFSIDTINSSSCVLIMISGMEKIKLALKIIEKNGPVHGEQGILPVSLITGPRVLWAICN